MDTAPLVSTIICTYNADRFIKNTLLSVLRQSYQNQEILILDNASTDATREIILELAKDDSRIQLMSEGANLGAYNGLNYLIDRAKGDYIAIQDHDDIWHPEKLQIQIDFLEKNHQYIGSGTGSMMYYSISKLGFFYDDHEYDTTKVIHTSLVFRNKGFRYDVTNDFLCDGYFMQNILTKGEKILHVHPEILTLHYYKQNGTNYSEMWFKVNWKNIKRYYQVYGYYWYYTLLLGYILTLKILPNSWRQKLDFFLLMHMKKAKHIDELRNESGFYKELLQYY